MNAEKVGNLTSAHPYVAMAIIAVLILIIIFISIKDKVIPSKEKKQDDELDKLVDSINKKQNESSDD